MFMQDFNLIVNPGNYFSVRIEVVRYYKDSSDECCLWWSFTLWSSKHDSLNI